MGVTMTVALAVWLASSLIEYKIVKASPTLKVLFRGIPGIIISLSIGFALGIFIGAAGGAGFILGQLLGLATNEFTFKMYSTLADWNARAQASKSKWQARKDAHPKVWSEAVQTIRLGFKTIAAVILGIVYVIGLPARAVRLVREQNNKLNRR